ncbi:helix-turn-helix domain-containing protein [Mesorhizobium sp. 1B3]|uniref:helix-turn-helix domain-containing protein n=1 Tax=Mesorhizobium sp. 1B3 TaxID=3243599 RepID=UPI003D9719F6
MITPAQCRAARALAELTRAALCRMTGVEESAIERFERKIDEPDEQTVAKLQNALEEAGVVFIPENGGGAGVRLKFNSSVTRRLGILEGEGGIVRNDDVP